MAYAQTDTKSTSGAAFNDAVQRHYKEEIDGLPWAAIQDAMKGKKRGLMVVSASLITGSAKANLDPQVAKSGTLDLAGAERLLHDRYGVKVCVPLKESLLAAVAPYIAAQNESG